MSFINTIPVELVEKIFKYMDGTTVVTCKLVCKEWQEFVENNESLWCEICKKEYKYASQIAKRKCGDSLTWSQLYRNLKVWPYITECEKNVKKFYNFTKHDNRHALDIENGILALKETNGTVLYDMNTMKYIPIALPSKNCYKISNNYYMTAILTDRGLFVQRSVENNRYTTEMLLQVDQYLLHENVLYYNKQRDVFKCDMNSKDMSSKLILTCEYNICGLQHSEDLLHLFTDCGEIISYRDGKKISRKMINCPEEWIKRVKHICALDDKNIVCYSKDLFYIETVDYKHLFLDFPPITALFFYGDTILIGTYGGLILLYQLGCQKQATKPIFEQLAVLPDEKIAVTLDVYEKLTGPVIVVSTFLEVFLIEVDFFGENKMNTQKKYNSNNILLFKRLLRLKERMKSTL